MRTLLPLLFLAALAACDRQGDAFLSGPVGIRGEAGDPAGNPVARDPQEEKEPEISSETGDCIDCHESVTPGIVADWRASRHAHVTPEAGLRKKKNERRISAESVPDGLKSVVVGCYECHGLNTGAHKDSFDHYDFRINVVVSPKDCRTCHPVETDEYSASKMAHAVENLLDNPLYRKMVETVVSHRDVGEDALVPKKVSDRTFEAACLGCHGTAVTVKGVKTIETESDEIEVPDLTGWPNQGVGRVNPDGSRGACTSCHPRHGFSIEVARKPHTCAQCHLEPDTPAWEVYRESKHGNIYLSEHAKWNWDRVPWVVGRDFRAPTCAVCHAAALANEEGDILVPRSHDFGSRLWVRIFGLPYAHPQPKTGKTHTIRNKDGQPLPVTFSGEPAAGHLISEQEQKRRMGVMKSVCLTCHGTDWTDRHFDRLADVVTDTNRMTLSATKVLQRAWDRGLADSSNPFDEWIERKWMRQWLFYSNSVRYAAAMGSSDLATFKNGWWYLTENLQKMHEWVREKSKK